MTTVTGGSAFPTVDANREADYGTTGMTLRDYFAIRAAPLVAVGHSDASSREVWVRPRHFQSLAADCYALADAFIAERAK